MSDFIKNHTQARSIAPIQLLVIMLTMLTCAASTCEPNKQNEASAHRIFEGSVQYLGEKELNHYKTTRPDGAVLFHLPKGLYIIKETIHLPSNSVLQGVGPETELKVSPNFKGSRLITNSDFIRGNKGIVIRSLKVDFRIKELSGDLPGIIRFENVSNLEILDVSMDLDSKYYGIDLSAATKQVIIQDCLINNRGTGGGIQVRNRRSNRESQSRGIRIMKNQILSVTDEPIAVFGWMGAVEDVHIENNTTIAIGASFGISAYGIDKPTHTGKLCSVNILANIVTGGKIGGITAKGGANNIRIENNQINNTHNDGIFIENGGRMLPAVQNIVVINNTVEEAGRYGIYAKGLEIDLVSNIIRQSKAAGIFLATHGSGRINALNNNILMSRKGIIVSGRGTVNLEGNKFDLADGIIFLEE